MHSASAIILVSLLDAVAILLLLAKHGVLVFHKVAMTLLFCLLIVPGIVCEAEDYFKYGGLKQVAEVPYISCNSQNVYNIQPLCSITVR